MFYRFLKSFLIEHLKKASNKLRAAQKDLNESEEDLQRLNSRHTEMEKIKEKVNFDQPWQMFVMLGEKMKLKRILS